MTTDQPVTAGVLLIGDEILSGRVVDANLAEISRYLGAHGVEVAEVRVVADDIGKIVAALNVLRTENHYVVTTGGIGPTHDDVTAEAVAAAFGVPTHEHPEILAQMHVYWPDGPSEAQRRMARTPVGATTIKPPQHTFSGFAYDNVFVLAGVPGIAKAMLNDIGWRLRGGAVTVTRVVGVEGSSESVIAATLAGVAQAHPAMTLGSYPIMGRHGATLVLRGRDPAEVEAAVAELLEGLHAIGVNAAEQAEPTQASPA